MSPPPLATFDHLHLGAGKLGLGLILPTAIDAGARVHLVVHRRSTLRSDATLACFVCYATGARERRELAVASISVADAIGDLEPSARAALVDAPELLITTAITSGGIADQAAFLVELAQERDGKPTIFIACENDCGPAYPKLVEDLHETGADVRRAVVNRVCSDLEEDAALRDGERAVRAFHSAEWIIEGAPSLPLLAALDAVPYVRFVDDIEPYEVRKRWLVNGTHLAIALLAKAMNYGTIDGAATELQARDGWIYRLHDVLVPLIEQRFPVLEGTRAWASNQLEVMLQHEEDPVRILRRLRRADLLPFIQDFERKLGEPARALVESGSALAPELHRVFDELEASLADIGIYRDYSRFQARDMHLSATADAEVTRAYHRLLSALVPLPEADRRVGVLERALRRHRVQLGCD